MAINDFLFGRNERLQQIPRFAPNETNALNQILSQGLGNLNSLQNKPLAPLNFEPIAQNARSQFAQTTLPLISERFSALPGQGGQRSSAFQGALSSANANLENSLAALGSQFALQNRGLELQERGQQQNLLQSLLGFGLQPRFQTLLRPETQGLFGQLNATGSQAAGAILPLLLGMFTGGSSLPFTGLGGGGNTGGNNLFALSGGLGSGYNPNMGFGQQDFAGSFGRGLMF